MSPGMLLIPLKRAGIDVAIPGLETEAVGWLGGCNAQQ